MDGPKTPKRSSQELGLRTFLYAVQCEECFKWRLIKTREEYEDIRSKLTEEPFHCNRKPNISCDDPPDIEYDDSRTWVSDKPNIPKTPQGFQRKLVPRKDFSKVDAYYVSPSGKKLRSIREIESYLEANKRYNGFSLSEFSYASPKIMEDTLPANLKRQKT